MTVDRVSDRSEREARGERRGRMNERQKSLMLDGCPTRTEGRKGTKSGGVLLNSQNATQTKHNMNPKALFSFTQHYRAGAQDVERN